MVKRYVKIIMKSKYRDALLQMVADIAADALWWYDVKRLSGKKNLYRIRIGDVRCVFVRTATGNNIVLIDNRWDAYKWL